MLSIQPPKYPEIAPMVMPINSAIIATAKPMVSEMRPANKSRLKTSRPSSSVPIICSAVKPWLRTARFCSSGSYGAIHGAKITAVKRIRMVTMPSIARWCRRNRRQIIESCVSSGVSSNSRCRSSSATAIGTSNSQARKSDCGLRSRNIECEDQLPCRASPPKDWRRRPAQR